MALNVALGCDPGSERAEAEVVGVSLSLASLDELQLEQEEEDGGGGDPHISSRFIPLQR